MNTVTVSNGTCACVD